MIKPRTHTDRTPAPAGNSRATARSAARDRLLAGLPLTERRLTLNGVSTALLEGGQGTPIVLLHGPGAYGAQWRVIPDLVRTHRVIAPDLPGHGASRMFVDTPDDQDVAGWLDDLIECTCSGPAVLVGHALGGALAARFAAEHDAGRLRALVLVDTLGLSAFQPQPGFGSALQEFLSAPTARHHDRLWSQCVFDLTTLRARMGGQWEQVRSYSLELAQTPERLAALRTMMATFGLPAIPPATLARIAVPTTLIWGREDRATALSVAEQASGRFGWGLRVIDDAADDPALEQPDAFVNALHAVLHTPRPEDVPSTAVAEGPGRR